MPRSRSSRSSLWVATFLMALGGCAAWQTQAPLGRGDTPASPSAFWVPPRGAVPPPPAPQAVEIPEEFKQRAWGLADVLDLALRNSPVTRGAWADARAAAARYGVEQAALYPTVNLDGTGGFRATNNTATDSTPRYWSTGPAANLSWLLLDFGSRSASIDSAWYLLLSSDFTYNRVLQDTILQVQQAYYLYMAAKALRVARLASLQSAELNLKAAEERHAAGVATIADVLQTRTSASQAKLELQSAEGAIRTTRGALAASMGLPANLSFDIEELPRDVSYGEIAEQVDALIGEAMAKRPDLAAARALALASEAQVRKVEGQGLPTLTLGASGGTTYIDVAGGTGSDRDRREDVFGAGLLLRFPLFTGYAQTYNVERAKAEAESSRQRVQTLEQQAIFQVFAAYNALQTATQKVQTTKDLLASGQQSEAVALGRYREGVGTIVDLVTAQSALADARGKAIEARWQWHTALAQLTHDTGLIGLHGESPLRQEDNPEKKPE